MKKQLMGVISHWLPLGFTIVLLSGLIYGAAQQLYRQELNDPQVQIVEDAQKLLTAGAVQPKDLIGNGPKYDVSEGLSPFIAVYDESGNLLDSSATIDDEPLMVPLGVLEEAKKRGENRITWQPNATTRIALVVRPLAIESGWYVVSGRNMKEGEARIQAMGQLVGLGCLVALLGSLLFDFLGDVWRRKNFKM